MQLPQLTEPAHVGREYRFADDEGEGAYVVADRPAYDRMIKATLLKDRETFLKLARENEVIQLDPGTRVLVLELFDVAVGTARYPSAELRVLSGPHEGKTVCALAQHLHT